jgi:hypothetical protein
MMASENRVTLFGIMLWPTVGRGPCRRQVDEWGCGYAVPAIGQSSRGALGRCEYANGELIWGLFFRAVKKIAILTRRLF